MALTRPIIVLSLMLTPAYAAGEYPSASDSLQIDRAILLHELAGLGRPHGPGRAIYVAMQGRPASQNFLDSLQKPELPLQPWPANGRAENDENPYHIWLNIGGFPPIKANQTHVDVHMRCGSLCGSVSNVIVAKVNGTWMMKFKTNIVSD